MHKRNPMDQFSAAVQTWPEVVECAALTGEMDYLLQVVVEDMAHYSRFIMETLLKHPSVEDCKSSFVLERLKTGAPSRSERRPGNTVRRAQLEGRASSMPSTLPVSAAS